MTESRQAYLCRPVRHELARKGQVALGMLVDGARARRQHAHDDRFTRSALETDAPNEMEDI